MKILGGKLKGRNFFMPAQIRPTQNVTRKAVFDLLGHDLSGLAVLELFAGSGAVGLEALSWGAEKVVFVDNHNRCAEIIEHNLEQLGIKDGDGEFGEGDVIEGDAFAAIKMLAHRGVKFDMIFADPPYGMEMVKKTLKTLLAHDILRHNCYLIIQHNFRETLPESEGRFSLIRHRKYGKTYLAVFEAQ